MTLKPMVVGAMLAALALAGCEQNGAEKTAVAQGSTPEGTISDELPDLELLPNDAPLADPSDVPPVPGVVAPGAPVAGEAAPVDPAKPKAAAPAAPKPAAPRPAEPKLEGSIAE